MIEPACTQIDGLQSGVREVCPFWQVAQPELERDCGSYVSRVQSATYPCSVQSQPERVRILCYLPAQDVSDHAGGYGAILAPDLHLRLGSVV